MRRGGPERDHRSVGAYCRLGRTTDRGSGPGLAGRILGDGIAIDPIESTRRAPCAGVVTTLHRPHHAVTLRAGSGLEVLMHIGLETVALGGQGFTPHV